MCSSSGQAVVTPEPIERQAASDPSRDAALDRTRQRQRQATTADPGRRSGSGITSTIATSARGAVPLASNLQRTLALGG